MPYIKDNYEIKQKETHVQEVHTPVGAGRLYLGQLRKLVEATADWPEDTVLHIEENHLLQGAVPTIVLRRDVLAADNTEEK